MTAYYFPSNIGSAQEKAVRIRYGGSRLLIWNIMADFLRFAHFHPQTDKIIIPEFLRFN